MCQASPCDASVKRPIAASPGGAIVGSQAGEPRFGRASGQRRGPVPGRAPGRRYCACILAGTALALLSAGPAAADSIYPVERARNMIADRKAHAVGDVV